MDFLADNQCPPFDALATGFSQENAAFLAQAANLVYESQEVIQTVTQEMWQFPGFQFIEGRLGDEIDTQGFVISNHQALIIAFRGTEEKVEDYATNMESNLVPLYGGQVHSGFKDAYDIVAEQLKNSLAFLHTNLQKIWICGHSLGGALATIAAAHLLDLGYEISGVYTFGQPRVGNEVFAETLNYLIQDKYYRIVNQGDIITRVPPKSLGYKHAGTFVFLTDEGEIAVNDPHWESVWRDGGSGLAALLDMAIGDLDEHSLKYYIRKLS
jgi:triacylglycerol lipase